MPSEEEKPIIQPEKSSMEILSELFGSFDAEPPIIIKKEKDETKKHHKKGKKKHKKEKKHKKKRKRSDSNSSQRSGVDLAELLIKQERQSPEKKIKLELDGDDVKDGDLKVSIKDMKFSSILEANMCKVHNGEVPINDAKQSDAGEKRKKKKRKHKHEEKSKKKKKTPSSSKEKVDKHKARTPSKEKSPETDYKSKDKCKSEKYRYKSKHRDRDSSKEKDRHRNNSRDRDERRSKYRERSKSNENYSYKHKDYVYYNEDKWFMKDRYKGYSDLDKERERKYKERSRSRDRDTHIDKKKLLEIARRNAIQMMKSGSLPGALTLGRQAQEKVLAAIRAGGKTIEELTDFCKTLSKKEELGELSSVSGEEGDSENESRAFHHPFQIKDRPTGIVMNIKNSIPLPTKTAQERTTELRMQFPVSSGTQHRKTENEWIPVSPKKVETPPLPPIVKPVPIPIAPPMPAEPPPPTPAPPLPGPQIFLESPDASIDIGAIVSQRLTAMRKLQENPYDVEALNEMHKSQKEMQTWAESKQQPGQFTGSTGAQILTQAELSAGYQAWARKDQLQNAAPVCGGMGMHLLKKMGWNPGEGLGKEKTGALEPLLLEVKLDKKGLVANEEQKRKQQKLLKSAIKTLEGKHPVSLLGEYTAKKKLGAPQYTLCMESGPDHKKLFLFKVTVNGMEYKPESASPNKKQAKADAAKLCLQQMGLLIVNGK
ncbi:hypothetical protein RN001_006883 [Aquatica leii]|uniref:Protein SON n=1 Tax=Aquatica leii TaxID=1421715 RepID=A0AAN7Q293_9COLE|nr:hypothetical protein RN001_006883 [Aquatica leii]